MRLLLTGDRPARNARKAPPAVAENTIVTEADARLAGLYLSAAQQAWKGAVGGPPEDGSPLAVNLAEEHRYATDRLSTPMSQAWTYAETVGLVAHDHLVQLQESLLSFSNGQGTCPKSSVQTMTRVAMESLSTQRWLIDPSIDTWERYKRWICLETISTRHEWAMLHDGEDHARNPELKALYEDADANQLRRHPRGEWIGVEEPKATDQASLLLSRFDTYAPHLLAADDAASLGTLLYRLLSGAVHGSTGHVLSSLVGIGETTEDGLPVVSYRLTTGILWQCVIAALIAKFTAGCEYAAWVGKPVPAEAVRLMRAHYGSLTDRMV